jgi:uncharacterized LabA/DUF88 family protein
MAGSLTFVYVDAFNLYFGALKGTPYRWLDLQKLCRLMLTQNDVLWIRYFTALVKPRKLDPEQPSRQQVYLRALKTLPGLSVHFGHFLSHKVKMPLAETASGSVQYVDVIKTEEKGSDVNLAAHLLNDAYQGRYETAVVISNDSDLLEPIKMVRELLGKKVGILNPHRHPSIDLRRFADFFKKIRPGTLAKCQFPSLLSDEHGSFSKPATW